MSDVAEDYQPFLVVEVGTAMTRVALIDAVDDTYRLIARSETWSTHRAPIADLTVGILQAVEEIAATTGRELIRNGQLLVPMDTAGNGVREVVVTTSAGGTMPVLVMGLAAAGSVQSARQAARASYTRLLPLFALDEGGNEPPDWLNRQIFRIAQSRPELILVAGGTEGGTPAPLQRLINIVRLVVHHQQPPPVVVFAGNGDAVERARTTLGPETDLRVVDNLRPTAGQVRLEPARAEIRRVYADRHAQTMPGLAQIHKMRVDALDNVATNQGLMIRFLAERFKRNILGVDMGATTASALLHSEHHYSEAIFGGCGTQAGALDLLSAVGADAILRWLPFELDADALENRLLNRRLMSPHAPADLDDLLLDHALLREGLRLVFGAICEERPQARFDLAIAGGAVARAPQPGLAAMTLLDAWELDGSRLPIALDLYLDPFGLLAASGVLARVNVDAAACIIEHDGLNSGALATVVLPYGDLRGEIGVAELTPVGGTTLEVKIQAGTIVRLPLPRGKRGTLRIKPARGVAIGANAPGEMVVSNEAAITGSALGVVIDARPRPLQLPPSFAARQQMLLAHLRTLDALPVVTAYGSDGGTDDAKRLVQENTSSSNPTGIVADEEDDGVPVGMAGQDNDLAALRQEALSTPPPATRGRFSRKA
ncbi:MAG: glutamate mutase L [Herpetosiphon sp.]